MNTASPTDVSATDMLTLPDVPPPLMGHPKLRPNPHRTQGVRKLECFSFDVACMQCGHPHLHEQVPFARIPLRVASRVLCVLGLTSRCTISPLLMCHPPMPSSHRMQNTSQQHAHPNYRTHCGQWSVHTACKRHQRVCRLI